MGEIEHMQAQCAEMHDMLKKKEEEIENLKNLLSGAEKEASYLRGAFDAFMTVFKER